MPGVYYKNAEKHSEYVVLIVFLRQHWLRERSSILLFFIRTLPVFVILFCSLFRSARLLSPTVFSSQLHCYHLSRREPVHLTRSIAIRIPRLSIVFTFCYATSVSIFHHPFILTYFVHPIERDLIILIFGY